MINCTFTVYLNITYSIHYITKAGVPQRHDVPPSFTYFSLMTIPITYTSLTSLGTYTDDTLITTSYENHDTAGDSKPFKYDTLVGKQANLNLFK